MLKRLLSLFLALLLLFTLCACDETPETPETPDDSTPTPPTEEQSSLTTTTTHSLTEEERAYLKTMIEVNSVSVNSIDVSQGIGATTVALAKYVSCNAQSLPQALRNVQLNGVAHMTKDLVLFDEREFYSEAAGEYVYVMSFADSVRSPDSFNKLTAISVANGVVTLNMDIHFDMDQGDTAAFDYLLIFKLSKAFLGDGVNELQWNFNNIWISAINVTRPYLREKIEQELGNDWFSVDCTQLLGNLPVTLGRYGTCDPSKLCSYYKLNRTVGDFQTTTDGFVKERDYLLYPNSSSEHYYLVVYIHADHFSGEVKGITSLSLDGQTITLTVDMAYDVDNTQFPPADIMFILQVPVTAFEELTYYELQLVVNNTIDADHPQ